MIIKKLINKIKTGWAYSKEIYAEFKALIKLIKQWRK
jgi:hypothetical protein